MSMMVSGKTSFKPAPEGIHNAVCVDVVDMGMQPSQWGPREKLRIVFQIEPTDPETNKRYMVSQWFTKSLHKKAQLNKFLGLWTGKQLTKEIVEKGIDLEKFVGYGAQLVIQHNEADGEVYANITAIMKPKVKMALDKDYVRVKDRPGYVPPGTKPAPAAPAGDESPIDGPPIDEPPAGDPPAKIDPEDVPANDDVPY